MKFNFYDIESLSNVFTLANYKPSNKDKEHDVIDIYILCDDETTLINEEFRARLKDQIYLKNRNFRGQVHLYNLRSHASRSEQEDKYYEKISRHFDAAGKDAFDHLAKTFGLSTAYPVNNPDLTLHSDKKTVNGNCEIIKYDKAPKNRYAHSIYPGYYRPVCDTDTDYDEDKHPYLVGYNSANYDTTILAMFFHESLVVDPETNNDGILTRKWHYKECTAQKMRVCNDAIFNSFKDKMPSYLLYDHDPDTGDALNQSNPNYSAPAHLIRRAMIMSGRQIDASNLNEKQRKVGLKRLLGMMGFQILESDKLSTNQSTLTTPDELYDLIAYNVSDVVNLAELFNLDLYQAQFTLKRQLLRTYPELIYDELKGTYKPDKRPSKVRKDRLYIDSTSSQFAQKTLCPYGKLDDNDTVQFIYPNEDKAKEIGVTPVDVLEQARAFFHEKYKDRDDLIQRFDAVYANYAYKIKGKNFNGSVNYQEKHRDAHVENSPKMEDNCIPYFDHDGNETSCFANFSVGGVHGAEYNIELYKADMAEWEALKKDFDQVREEFPDHNALREAAAKKKTIIAKDGTEWKSVIFNRAAKGILLMSEDERTALIAEPNVKGKVKNDMKLLMQIYTCDELDAIVNKPVGVDMHDGRILPVNTFLKPGNAGYKDIDAMKPELFKQQDGSRKLNPKYVYTSFGVCNHEDFTSYYPNLLRMMKAFFNEGLGYDRYAEIFQQKQDYGFLMKPKNADLTPEQAAKYRHLREQTNLPLEELHISDEERNLYKVLREGTKLILNSASGAGDATFDNNIRMNNNIIAMRVIGQLFSWQIGQAQAYEGAKIISTNTDGLYSVMEEKLNNEILERESKSIGVEIEPEPLYLISKDTNNRIELTTDCSKITGASGGTVACRTGPKPDKSLAHPAIIDWALCEYLRMCATNEHGLAMDKPFNDTIGMEILKSAYEKHGDNPVKWLQMFQNVLASSPGSIRYIFGIDPGVEYNEDEDPAPNGPMMPHIHVLPHYNRVFYMKDGSPNCYHLRAAFAAVTSASEIAQKKAKCADMSEEDKIEMAKNEGYTIGIQRNIPWEVMKANGVTKSDVRGKTVKTIKLNGIDPEWYVHIQNKALNQLDPAEFMFIWENLDYEKYLSQLRDSFENNWRNHLPYRHYVKFFNLGSNVGIETVMNGDSITEDMFPEIAKQADLQCWNTSPDGTGTTLNPGDIITEDMTVYSVYNVPATM